MADVTPHEVRACVDSASSRYAVPSALLYAILRKEGGSLGMAKRNRNGSYDYGPAQINSSWEPQLKPFNITSHHLKNSLCTNIQVGAWILKRIMLKTNDWTKSIASYHVGERWLKEHRPVETERGMKYAYDVIKLWHQYHAAGY